MFDDDLFIAESPEFVTTPLDKVEITVEGCTFEVDLGDSKNETC